MSTKPPKVVINDTPTAQIIAASIKSAEITDSLGRTISLTKPGPLAQYRLVEALGAATAANQVYMGMAMPLMFVTAIDGEDVAPPTRKSEVEALINRLGDEGITALMVGVSEKFGPVDPEGDKVKLKKPQQPPL